MQKLILLCRSTDCTLRTGSTDGPYDQYLDRHEPLGDARRASTDYRPAKGLVRVLKVFRGNKDDWGLAYWFASANSFLGGKRPQDLLISKPDRVVAAAEDEVAGVLHG